MRNTRKTVADPALSRTTPQTGSALGAPPEDSKSSHSISRRASAPFALLRFWAFVVLWVLPLSAGQPEDIRKVLAHVATALTDSNPDDAMSVFSKSFVNYDTVRDDFQTLTDSYQLTNEIDVSDEKDSQAQSRVTIQWSITMTDKYDPNQSSSRSGTLHVTLAFEKKKWKIVDLSPLDIFNPQAQAPAKR